MVKVYNWLNNNLVGSMRKDKYQALCLHMRLLDRNELLELNGDETNAVRKAVIRNEIFRRAVERL